MRVEAIAGARRSTGTGARTWRQWLGVWALWTVLAAVGGIAGGAVTWSWATEVLVRGFVAVGRTAEVAAVLALAGLATGAAAGLVGGLGEWLLLRRWVARAGRWIVVTAVGRAVGWSLALTVGWLWSELVVSATGSGAAGILGLDVGGLVGGSAVGLSQWIVLRRWVARSSLWIAASAVGGAAGIGLSQYVAQAAAGGVIAGGLAWVSAVAVAAAGVGAVTGVALVLLLAPPHNHARQPAARRPDRLRRAAPAVVTVLLVSVGLVVPVWYYAAAVQSAAIRPAPALLSQTRLEAAVAAAGSKIVIAGGLVLDISGGSKNLEPSAAVDIYDTATGAWTAAELSRSRSMLAAAGVGSTALFAGGHDGSVDSAVIDIYDGATDTWSTAKLSELRTGVVVTTVGTKVLIAGGCLNDSCSRLSKVVDIYDTATGTWTTAALSEGRDNLAATRIGSKVFLAYGPGAVVEIYDDSTGAWSTAPLSLERVGLVATSVGSKAFFAGGQVGKYRADSGRVDIYDASTDTWSTAKLPWAGGADLAAGTVGTKAFFADGPRGIVDIYDDRTGTWNTATLSQRRHGLAMAIVGTKAFFAGGHDLSHYSDVVDVYDASTGDWTTTSLSEGRLLPVAGSAGTAVVVAGGNADREISGVVDTFDTATDAWTDAGSNLRRLLRDLRERGNPSPLATH